MGGMGGRQVSSVREQGTWPGPADVLDRVEVQHVLQVVDDAEGGGRGGDGGSSGMESRGETIRCM